MWHTFRILLLDCYGSITCSLRIFFFDFVISITRTFKTLFHWIVTLVYHALKMLSLVGLMLRFARTFRILFHRSVTVVRGTL